MFPLPITRRARVTGAVVALHAVEPFASLVCIRKPPLTVTPRAAVEDGLLT